MKKTCIQYNNDDDNNANVRVSMRIVTCSGIQNTHRHPVFFFFVLFFFCPKNVSAALDDTCSPGVYTLIHPVPGPVRGAETLPFFFPPRTRGTNAAENNGKT